ncbi:hypothetical protein [Plantactinospora sp. GCM10030261]|uniref:Rv0361 family membrane protein n=1 Tax=Plantactinospora sp. GCM10030261 TaxID=3273420 RepID=UPI00360FBC77
MPHEPRAEHAPRRPLTWAAGLALLLVCGLLGIGGWFLFRPAQEPATAVRIATDAFVGRLIAGDYGAAYDGLCADTRERFDREEFVDSVAGRPAVRSYQIEAIEDGGAGGFTVRLTLADPSGTTAPQVFRVVPDRGAWRVCGDPLPAG